MADPAEHLKADKRMSVTLFVGCIGLGLAAFFNWNSLPVSSGVPMLARFFLCFALVTALYAFALAIYAAWTADSKGVWRIASTSAFGTFVLGLIGILILLPDNSGGSKGDLFAMSIPQSNVKLTLDGRGNAVLLRDRIIAPKEDIEELIETNFYAEAGLSVEDFRFSKLYQIDSKGIRVNDSDVTCIVEYVDGPRAVYERFTPPLRKGRRYKQVMTITANGSFSAQDKDWLIVNCVYPCSLMTVAVEAQGGLELVVDEKWPHLNRQAREGVPEKLPYPTVQINTREGNNVSWVIASPKVGDRYVAEWVYPKGKGPDSLNSPPS